MKNWLIMLGLALAAAAGAYAIFFAINDQPEVRRAAHAVIAVAAVANAITITGIAVATLAAVLAFARFR